MAPQVTRISIFFACLVFAFAGSVSVISPSSIGQLGPKRYDSLARLQNQPEKYSGNKPCITCHGNSSPHAQNGVPCEACHGPGAAHSKDKNVGVTVLPTRAACGICHESNAAKRVSFPQVGMTTHYPNQRCVDCHKMHMYLNPKPSNTTKPAVEAMAAGSAPKTGSTKPTAPDKLQSKTQKVGGK